METVEHCRIELDYEMELGYVCWLLLDWGNRLCRNIEYEIMDKAVLLCHTVSFWGLDNVIC